ncbi:MAG: hypothetical protein U0350_41425 [Caldilineaceae bacterium]
MSTYEYDKVMADYEHGRITAEMATGHSLQHIGKLYKAQTVANANQHAAQAKLDALEQRVNAQQVTIDRLTAFMEKVLRAQKQRNAPSQPKSDQP